MKLVDIKTLYPVLIENALLSEDLRQALLLTSTTNYTKAQFLHNHLLSLGKTGYEKFMKCLEHHDVKEHAGHVDLYKLMLQIN